MKKSFLKSLPKLKATPAMMKRAAADTPKTIKLGYYNTWEEKKYTYGMYLRARNCKGILKVAIFLTEDMREGYTSPAYELYINPEIGGWLTYDTRKDKWLTAKLNMIEWPNYVRRSDKKYANRDTNQTIRRRLKVDQGGYAGILKYQIEKREENLVKKYKRETEPWDMDMELVPEHLPKNWMEWVDKKGIQEHYIFYDYSKKGSDTGYCTYCKKMVPINKPKYNDIRKCKCCGQQVTLKSTKKCGSFYTKRYPVALLQKTEEGFVIREFAAYRHYYAGKHLEPEISCNEFKRILYNSNLNGRSYRYDDYKQHEIRWVKESYLYGNYYGGWMERCSIYPYTLPNLKKTVLKETGLPEYIKSHPCMDPEQYMEVLKRNPVLEQIVKAGLNKLAEETIEKWIKKPFGTGNKLTEQLKIDKSRLKRLRQQGGGITYLKWLQEEKRLDTIISDEVIKWFSDAEIRSEDLAFITDRMSPEQVRNYLIRQKKGYPKLEYKAILEQWRDYLSMCSAARKNLQDEMVYRPRELKRRHDEMVIYREKASIMERMKGDQKYAREYAKKMADKFPQAEENLKKVKEKYEYSNEDYKIMVPEHLIDITREGHALHHCAGATERYFERMTTGETYICFLRRADDPDIPFYTIEVEPNGTIRQTRTYLDEETGIEEIRPFLKKWQQEIKKRMKKEDHEAQIVSKRKREENIMELQREGNTRVLQALMEDFMEAM